MKTIKIAQLMPDAPTVLETEHRDGNVATVELQILSFLARDRHCLLEIGTFDGRTTTNLALHSPADAIVHTIDLPLRDDAASPIGPADGSFILGRSFPRRYERYPELRAKIVQLWGDSTAFDFGALRPDFIFVDGCHQRRYVEADTDTALRILSPGGIVIWHDYPVWKDVREALDARRRDRMFDCRLSYVEETTLVVYR